MIRLLRLLALPFAASTIVGEAYIDHRPVWAALCAWVNDGRLV